jgi:hypothetical protein
MISREESKEILHASESCAHYCSRRWSHVGAVSSARTDAHRMRASSDSASAGPRVTTTASTYPASTYPASTYPASTYPATATPLGANPCAASSDASIMSQLRAWDVPAPANAIVVDQGSRSSDDVAGSADFQFIGVCAQSISPDNVWEFYFARMPASGWTRSATVPAPGVSNSPCSARYCWTKDAGQGTTLIVTLKNLAASGSSTAFTVVYERFSKPN